MTRVYEMWDGSVGGLGRAAYPALKPPWQVWFAWHPVRVRRSAAAYWTLDKWVWLAPVARRRISTNDWRSWEYAPAHYAITQEGR